MLSDWSSNEKNTVSQVHVLEKPLVISRDTNYVEDREGLKIEEKLTHVDATKLEAEKQRREKKTEVLESKLLI